MFWWGERSQALLFAQFTGSELHWHFIGGMLAVERGSLLQRTIRTLELLSLSLSEEHYYDLASYPDF